MLEDISRVQHVLTPIILTPIEWGRCSLLFLTDKEKLKHRQSCCCCSVTKLCLAVCDPINCSKPGKVTYTKFSGNIWTQYLAILIKMISKCSLSLIKILLSPRNWTFIITVFVSLFTDQAQLFTSILKKNYLFGCIRFWLQHVGLVDPWHMGSYLTDWGWTCILYTGKQILNYWTTRKVHTKYLLLPVPSEQIPSYATPYEITVILEAMLHIILLFFTDEDIASQIKSVA